MKVMLRDVRLSFPNLWTPRAMEGVQGEPRYSASLLMSLEHPALAEVRKAIQGAAEEKWGAKAAETLKMLAAGGKICLRDGDSKSEYAGFAGNKFIQASNKVKPTVIDANKAPLAADAGRPYAGCYVNAQLDIWAQDNSFGKRINASLMGIQFWRDGDPFSGGGASRADDFDAAPAASDAVPF